MKRSLFRGAFVFLTGALGALALLATVVCADAWLARKASAPRQGPTFRRQGRYYVAADPTMIRQAFLADKPPLVFRVFVIGDSQAMGSPYVYQENPFWKLNEGGIATWLEPYLAHLLPDRRVEVINAAKGIHGLAASAETFREIAQFGRADLVILLSGNGERRKARVELAPQEDLEGEVAALSAKYEDSLARIVSLANEKSIPTYLLTVASNLRGIAPSDAAPGPGSGERNAIGLYRIAQAYDAKGDYPRAFGYYLRAKDQDRNFLRCRSRWNEAIRRSAKGPSARLLDLEKIIIARAKDGIPGFDLFLDYCHFNLPTNQLAALEVARFFAHEHGLARQAADLESVSLPDLSSRKVRLLHALNALKWKRLELLGRLGAAGRLNARAVRKNYLEAPGR